MSELIKWIDLRGGDDGARLKIAAIEGDDGQQRRYLYVVGMKSDSVRWKSAIDRLGFIASPNKKFLVRQSTGPIKPSDFSSVWPNASFCQLPRDQIMIDTKPIKQLRATSAERTEEERDVAVESGAVVRLGRNADGNEVFSGPLGRYVQRENGSKIYQTDMLGPATFLHAPDAAAMGACADGFVQAMLMGEVQRSDDLDRFILAVTEKEGPYSVDTYSTVSTAIDAAMVRFLSLTYDTAQDAYGDAGRLHEYLPPYKGQPKGAAAMPLPLSVIAQRLLGDTRDRHVLVPNAWDGASFAFMAQGTKIHAFRGDKDLSRHVSSLREEDVTWSARFDPAREQGSDGLFFNADPDVDERGERKDYRQALGALRVLNPDARAVLVLAGDDPREPGALVSDSRDFFNALSRRYDVESVVEVGAELSRQMGTGSTLRLISVRNRPAGEHSFRGDAVPVVHSWDDLKSHVDEVIATASVREAEAERIDVERIAAGNDFQRPYIAFSKVGEARTMVPKNLQSALQYALTNLESTHGPIDAFVEREMGFGPHTLEERFSPEQVDAVGLGIARMKSGRGIIIGDETGIGKGRTLSAYCTWANKQDRDVIFVTDRANLFSDLVRDLRDIGEWGRFRPLVMNADGVLVDVITNELIQEGTPTKVMNDILEKGTSLEDLQCNIIFTTYSQISGEDSPKAGWLLARADRAFVVVDEAHIAAGSNSNTSLVVSELVNRAWAAAYSSATWAKTSENLHIYSRAFPDSINIASLTSTMRTGGEAFSEVFSSMLARDGAFIRREHDLSKIEFTFEVDHKRKDRNEGLSDRLAGILSALTYVSGDINRLLMRLNADTMRELKDARSARAAADAAVRSEAVAAARARTAAMQAGQEGVEAAQAARPVARGSIMRSSFGAGSVLYQVMRRFLTVLNVDNVTDLALKAVQENRKPVIVFEDTGEVFLKRIIEQEIIPSADGSGDIMPTHVRAPTIKDLLRNVVKRMGVVTVSEVSEDYLGTAESRVDAGEAGENDAVDVDAIVQAQDSAPARNRLSVLDLPGLTPGQQKAYKEGMTKIMEMIEELPPMPLNSVDLLHARLTEAGLNVGEISGRSMRLEAGEGDRSLDIGSPAWDTSRLRIVPRSKKKVDVNNTVFGFNNGDLDVVLINRSAATGISLHASPRFRDIRRRELIEMQIPEDPTNRIQLFGRVNRYDQVVTPKISIATTGVYGEVRQLMMQNKKLARLSANIRSSRDNAAEIKDVPDLLNPVGREVCEEFLSQNGGIRNRLGITEKDMENGFRDMAQRLTSYVALLSVAEQRMVYEEVYAMFDDTLMRYEMLGENPLKPREKDVRAKTLSESLVIGVEMDGFGSAFDGPVYLRELQWESPKRPYSWMNALEFVEDARRKMVASGMLSVIPEPARKHSDLPHGFDRPGLDFYGDEPVQVVLVDNDLPVGLEEVDLIAAEKAVFDVQREHRTLMGDYGYSRDLMTRILHKEASMPRVKFSGAIDRLKVIMAAKVQIELAGSRFVDAQEAIVAEGSNGVKSAEARRQWVEKFLPRMVPGCSISVPKTMTMNKSEKAEFRRSSGGNTGGFYSNGLLIGLQAPPKGKEAMISRWKVDVLFPGKTEVVKLSLSSLMDGAALTATTGLVSEVLLAGDVVTPPRHDELTDVTIRRRELMDRFRVENRRSLVRTGYVLDGNMYMASEWASSTKMGNGVIYTDDRGVRHRGVWLDDSFGAHRAIGENMPVRLWSRTMVEGFLRELVKPEDAPLPNGPGGSYIIPTSFKAGMSGADSDAGTRLLLVPGKAVGMMVDKGDLARMLRTMRGYQKNKLRREHPDYRTYSPEQKAQADEGLVTITSSAKKRGQRPMIFLGAESVGDFSKVTELLCAAAGIELYLPRHAPLGRAAKGIQEAYFIARREAARRLAGLVDDPVADAPEAGSAAGEQLEDDSATPSIDGTAHRMREAA